MMSPDRQTCRASVATCNRAQRIIITRKRADVSSYNVLIDSEYPPTRDRDTFLVRVILSNAAAADILVLQEVSDDFLSHILYNSEIQKQYPYTSHGPPSQPDIGPLSSLRNIIILSRWHFSWRFLPFNQRHKGALVASFGSILQSKSLEPQDLIVAGVHLSAGLTDNTVAAKQIQLQDLIDYLEQQHGADPWIVAGDFNLATSTYTINTALESHLISVETVTALSQIETAFNDAGLLDTWTVAHLEATDDIVHNPYEELFEGEEGATFDPRNNILAATSSETSTGRPQRYDRVLVRSQGTLRTVSCNQFGLPEDIDGAHVVASDHSGIRTTLNVRVPSATNETEQHGVEQRTRFECKRASSPLSNPVDLSSVLATNGMFPTEAEMQQRKTALTILRRAVLGGSDDDIPATSDIPMVVVPVGSYALGVWTAESDIDCLCIGTISSKTFFKLARQRLTKAHDQGVRVLRKVEANTGTMLELSINGVAMDLQYCPAARVVER
jgi:endonuclease/exonuclease/phosphatase family metal-dependent hydrolase